MNAPIDAELLRPSVDVNLIPAPNGDGNLGEFFGALGTAQGAFEPILKNRTVMVRPQDKSKASYTFRYADLEEIRTKTQPHLTANGFCLTQLVNNRPDVGGVHIRTILGHRSGARMESLLDVPKTGGEIKDFGGYITYLRRYVVGAMLGVAADDDLDDNGQAPGEGDLPAPGTVAEHPALRDAKTVSELNRAMAALTKEEKAKFGPYFNRRMDELEDCEAGK